MSVLPLPALISALSTRDLTDPEHGAHALQLLVRDAVEALSHTWGAPARVIRTRPVVPIADNYDGLGYPPDAVSREVRYTRYVSDTCVLRSHTSAGVPPALRRLAREPDAPAEVLLALPGICHRRDSIDSLHTGTPHQLDLWLLRRGGRRLDHDDLSTMVNRLVDALLPGRHWRWIGAEHPYTTGGRQVDVIDAGEAVELAECGLAAPHVLRDAGLDPAQWTGLALGMGLDRALMLRKNIPDIRLLRSDEPRVAEQMTDLSPYRAVSTMPPARRDLSVAVAPDADAETLGDRVREALGAEADLVEEVSVLSATAHDELPAAARARLGIGPDQVNVLLRVVIRPADRTLTAAEINDLRDRVYAGVHSPAIVTGSADPSPSSAEASPRLTASARCPAEST
jgi:phenylalanyl-tRNA synthetase alpha chain